VQVDAMKATLKAPGYERLKLKCDVLPSSFAFKFNLRRYIEAMNQRSVEKESAYFTTGEMYALAAGVYTRPIFSST